MSNNDDDETNTSHVYTLLVDEMSKFINESHFDEALGYLKSLTDQQVYENTWDLCNYLFCLLEKPSDKLCNEYELYSHDALKYVAEHGNPREMLIIMLEQCDKFISDETFIFHKKLFFILLKRLPLRPSLITSLNDILTLLKCHLTTIELPRINHEFAGKDMLVYNHDHRIAHLLKLTQVYVDLISEIRDYFSMTSMTSILFALPKHLISLLYEPLISLSYEPVDSFESSSFTSIRPLLDCLFKLSPNPITLIDPKEKQQCVLVYLLLTKKDYFSLLPCVYSPTFYLLLSISFIQYLSSDHDQVMLTEKACVLVSNVCSRLKPNKEFDHTLLDNDEIHTLIDTLKFLMVQSPARQYATLTIGAYRSLFRSFDSYGRYVFLRQQLAKTQSTEDSYRTFLCTLVKDEFLDDYRSKSSEIYKGSSLFQLLDNLCRLPNGVESDLMEVYDCICSTLNFIRFIGLVDKRDVNRTLFWTERLQHINQTFFQPLRKSIELARAHYKLEIRNTAEGNKEQIKQPMDTEVLIDNKPLEMPSKKEQLETLHTTVTKFDILDCILSTLNETFGGELL